MKKIIRIKLILFLVVLLCFVNETAFAQTAFTINAQSISTTTGTTANYNSTVVSAETISGNCTESNANTVWNHAFLGTANKKLTGFTITSTSYYVNNYGSLTVSLKRDNTNGLVNPSSCGTPAPAPWNDRQIAFFEGTIDATANTTQIVNSFPSTTLPGAAGYNAVNDMTLVFANGFVNAGADNIFCNMSGTGSASGYSTNANNIERMDVFVSAGITVTPANINKLGFVIACRGTNDDPFTVSAIKALTGGTSFAGTGHTNYIYDDIIKFDATWANKYVNGGAAIPIAASSRVTLIAGMNTLVLRRMDTDGTVDGLLPSAEYPTISSYTAAQNIVGMFLTFADLGLVAGDVFYGYSVAGYDVNASDSKDFNSFTRNSVFPDNTTTQDGGVDLTGFPGMYSAIDIDDDDDGIPDFVELNNAVALQDHDTDGVPNWNDVNYAGFVDNNADLVNDNFDPGGDSDNDGTPNYSDANFSGYVDANANGVNDNMDMDGDGVPNFLDRDSDNDGIPDAVESLGVDANGEGIIDNYVDADFDGLSDNVDAILTGAVGSGNGLGAIDTDGDGVANYLDLDSDNDGLPDVREAQGTDAGNDGKIDSYTDTDSDGYSDNIDGDVGNDGTAENSANTLLRTGADAGSDGRADSYPYKNLDSDSKPQPYDLDSDNDGITDVREAGFSDSNNNGLSDGARGADGWDDTIDALGSLTIRNTDGDSNFDYIDVDADNDGIPDNIEGQTTSGYLLAAASDTDGDGLDNSYDAVSGFSGNGIAPNDHDIDGTPDYIDTNTDNDAQSDLIEGNDYNLNAIPDDVVTLTGVDTDGDGLDNRFDANNSSTEGTSQYMGNAGSFTGDGTPGSNTMVQRSFASATDRDWRYTLYVLDVDFISFTGGRYGEINKLKWVVTCDKVIDRFEIERSVDGVFFAKTGVQKGIGAKCTATPFTYSDNIITAISNKLYYRIKIVTVDGSTSYSNAIAVKLNQIASVIVSPNPATTYINISMVAAEDVLSEIKLIDPLGRVIRTQQQRISKGYNSFVISNLDGLGRGVYNVQIKMDNEVINEKIVIQK